MAPSWWLSFLDQTNIIVTLLMTCVVCGMRSAAAAYMGLGGAACAASAKLIKNLLRQPRPENEGSSRKRTYGMPSTHSAVITYFATYIVLACLILPIHPFLPLGMMARVILPIVVVPWAILVAMSRVWLGHHTWRQVIAGASYGVAFGSVWFSLWSDRLQQHGRVLERLVDTLIN